MSLSRLRDYDKKRVRAYFFILFFLGIFQRQVFGEPKPLGYRGNIRALQDMNIDSMALRSDGRYLFFYNSNSPNFYVVDLQDFARVKLLGTLENNIISLSLINDRTLAVVTTRTIQYYDVTKPFEIKSDQTRTNFSLNTGDSFSQQKACQIDSDGSIFVLQSDSKVRRIAGNTPSDFILLPDLTNNDSYSAISFHCTQDSFFVFASKNKSSSEATEYYYKLLRPGSVNNISFDLNGLGLSTDHYYRQDSLLSREKDQFMILFRRETSESNSEDSKVVSIPLSASGALTASNVSSRNLGTDVTAITNFLFNQASHFGFFIGRDTLGTAGLTDVFLSTILSQLFSSNDIFANQVRGKGSANVGQDRPTLTVSSNSDVYKILRTESLGLSLLSDAPMMQFTSVDNTTLTAAAPLQFTVQSDVNLAYDIRFIDDETTIDSTAGISNTPGTVIRSDQIANLVNDSNEIVGASVSVSISAADLNIQKDGDHSLIFIGRALNESLPIARMGLRFSYDPPPAKISDLSLGFGDQSVRASFALPKGGDMKTLRFYIAQNETDAQSITTARTIQTLNGTIDSPLDISADGWTGSHVFSPLENEQKIYIAVLAIDDNDQAGEISDTKSITPHATLTLAQAFGSNASCNLSVSETQSGPYRLLTVIFLFSVVLFVLRRSKKIGPSTSKKSEGRGLRSKGAGPKLKNLN